MIEEISSVTQEKDNITIDLLKLRVIFEKYQPKGVSFTQAIKVLSMITTTSYEAIRKQLMRRGERCFDSFTPFVKERNLVLEPEAWARKNLSLLGDKSSLR